MYLYGGPEWHECNHDVASCKVEERGRSPKAERKRTVPVLKLYFQRTIIQPAAGDGRSSTKVVLPENGIQLAAGDGRSSTKVVLENENAGSRPRRPFRYPSCTTREWKSSRPPETTCPVLKLYYHRIKIQPAAGDGLFSTKVVEIQPAAGDGRSSTKVVLAENERKSGRPPEAAVPVPKL